MSVTLLATILTSALVTLGICIIVYVVLSARTSHDAPAEKSEAPPRVERGTINIVRPSTKSVEGLEIQYERYGLVRSVRVGAMNSEHKELLLTMDTVAWTTMPNAQKQEVLAAARSTWAARMCPDGPDIAYVIVKTDAGDIVGRASPRSVTLV